MSEKKENVEEGKKRKKVWPWVLVFVLVICLFAGIHHANQPKTSEGAKDVTLEVVDSEGEKKDYEEKTDAAYLSDFMDELSKKDDFSYEAEKSDARLYVTTVNGEEADYDKDQAYWAIYVNGDYGQYGISEQPVSDGDSFTLKYETAQ